MRGGKVCIKAARQLRSYAAKVLICLDVKMLRCKVCYYKSSLRAIAWQSSENCHPEFNSGSINVDFGVGKEEPSPAFVTFAPVHEQLLPQYKADRDTRIAQLCVSLCLTKREGNSFNDTVFSRFTSHFSLKCAAFTLAEVLITLGIIGVVAALTMPSLVNDIQGKQLQSALKKGYSEISQAFELMKSDIGKDILPADYSPGTFVLEYKEYFVKTLSAKGSGLVSKDVDVVDFNGLKTYKTYNKRSSLILNYFDDGQFILPDGALILINDSNPMLISIDVNGMNKGPNLYGRDLFSFEITSEGKLLPVGAKGTSGYFLCSETSASQFNGGGCTYYAVTDPNYFKKRYYK